MISEEERISQSLKFWRKVFEGYFIYIDIRGREDLTTLWSFDERSLEVMRQYQRERGFDKSWNIGERSLEVVK